MLPVTTRPNALLFFPPRMLYKQITYAAVWTFCSPTLTALMPLGRERASLENWAQGGHESGGT
eukprot:SAG31_NODE_2632_length_5347_cov_2.022866_4_plen_63_part_00